MSNPAASFFRLALPLFRPLPLPFLFLGGGAFFFLFHLPLCIVPRPLPFPRSGVSFPATYPVDAHSTSHSSTPTTPTPISALVSRFRVSSPAFIAFLLCSSRLRPWNGGILTEPFCFSHSSFPAGPSQSMASLAIYSQRPHFGLGKLLPPIRYLDLAVLEERATRAEEARQMAERRIFELESQVRHSSH